MSNTHLKLPFLFDPGLLEKDLTICLRQSWVRHFNQNDFSGNWSSISLRSLSGREDDIYSHPGEYRNTPLLYKCGYFTHVLDQFQCEKESVRLLALGAGGIIKEHRDQKLAYEHGIFRIHIPVKTGPKVFFLVNKLNIQMNAGEVWYANFHLPHSVVNESNDARIHLIIDCRRNAWSDEWFGLAGYDFEEEKRSIGYNNATLEKIIAELEMMEGEAARQMIHKLRNQQPH